MNKKILMLIVFMIVLSSGVSALDIEWINITDPGHDDFGRAVAIDSNNNVYVAGYCENCGDNGGRAMYTMKFDSDGNHIWTNITDPTSSNDFAYGIATDSNDNVYVTGYCSGCEGSAVTGIYTMKFDSDGNHIWKDVTDPSIYGDIGYSITTDSNNNVYVTGECNGCGSSGSTAIYTMKFDSSGNKQWTDITDPSSGEDSGNSIATDSNNNVYVTGKCEGCGDKGNYAIYTMKFDSSGNKQWTNITDPSSYSDRGYGIATDSNNNVYVTGYKGSYSYASSNDSMYTMKFDSSGDHIWTNIARPTDHDYFGNSIATDSNNEVYIASRCMHCGDKGYDAFYILQLDSDGDYIDSDLHDPSNTYDYAYGIATDSNNDVYVTGNCGNCQDTGGHSIYTLKYSSPSANGEACSVNGDCLSGYCRDDYDDSDKFCADDSTSCVHDGADYNDESESEGYLCVSGVWDEIPVWGAVPVVVMDEDVTNNTLLMSDYTSTGCGLGCTYDIVSSTGPIQTASINSDYLVVVPSADGHGTGTVTVSADDGNSVVNKVFDVKVLSIPDLGSDITVDTGYFDGAGTTDLGSEGDDISVYQGESDPDHAYSNSVYFFSLERDLIGKVTFEGNFPFIWDLALASSNVIIDNGFIAVDSDSILSKLSYWIDHPTAKVELYNVDPSGYITDGEGVPIVYKNDSFNLASDPRDSWPECGTDCEPVNWNEETGTLTFYVDEFSSFGLSEDQQGGDNGGSVPEFSTLGIIMAVLVVTIGAALIIKKRR
ncbi:hypothetical protein GF336_07245 [Candidatus Woesearchaeota archaeon]|nr:hypothetical protein [Candidatus Woesearchaeota archaeon]